MDGFNSHSSGGKLQISSDAMENIAKHAALEIDGVCGLRVTPTAANSLLGRLGTARPVQIEMLNDVADVGLCIVVRYGSKLPEICEKVQNNVKNSIQSMTGITVGRVNIAVTGVGPEEVAG